MSEKVHPSGQWRKSPGNVQNASTHPTSCVTMDVAARHGHNAAVDVDAAALHSEKETSIQRGDG